MDWVTIDFDVEVGHQASEGEPSPSDHDLARIIQDALSEEYTNVTVSVTQR